MGTLSLRIKTRKCWFLNDFFLWPFTVLLALSSTVIFAAPELPENIWPYPPISSLRGVDDERFSYPHLPPFRLSRDGRIGVRVGRILDNQEYISTDIELYLITPEKLENPFLLNKPGIKGLSSTQSYKLPRALIEDMAPGNFGARAICDTPEHNNPSACPENKNNSCYNLSIVGAMQGKKVPMRFASIDVTIEIESPQTVNAKIKNVRKNSITLGEPMKGLPNYMVEPNITEDGLLWLAKFSGKPDTRWIWKNPTTNSRKYFPRESRPVVYSYNTKGACDVTGWTEFSPLSHAHYDDNIRDNYGFAHYPMRDPEGNKIKDGDIIAADQYPWLSHDGAMLFMETGGDMLFYKDGTTNKITSRYPVRCAKENDCALDYILGSNDEAGIANLELYRNINRRVVMFGSWTHGKMVVLDNVVNYMDYGPNDAIGQHLWVKIYESAKKGNGPHQDGEVLMAHNKQRENPIDGTVNDGAQLGSNENRFNHLPQLKPITPKDLVWLFSKGNGITTELAFDDFVAHDVLIYAQMNESFSNKDALSSELQGVHDGFTRTGNLHGKGFSNENPIRLQNAATIDDNLSQTSHYMNVPPYGEVVGNVRIEPYALGGIRGKGFWLDGSSGITFTLPPQNKAHAYTKHDWYMSMFVDQRVAENDTVKLFTFPNGNSIWLADAHIVFKSDNASLLAHADISALKNTTNWQHIGLAIKEKDIALYIDGLHIKTLKNISKYFALTEGVLSIGETQNNSAKGFRGWVDDFKLITINNKTSQERFCEHARGTLVAFENGVDNTIVRRAGLTEKNWQATIQHELDNTDYNSTQYYCYTDYASEIGANLAEIPNNTHSIRMALLQPQKIMDDQPRPDESNNAFCLSCHDTGLHPALSIETLEKRDIPAHLDSRQQPMEPPRGLMN